jgi:hypothetical protein
MFSQPFFELSMQDSGIKSGISGWMNMWWLPVTRSSLNPKDSAIILVSEKRIFFDPESNLPSNFFSFIFFFAFLR